MSLSSGWLTSTCAPSLRTPAIDSGGGLVTFNSGGGFYQLTGVQSYNMGCNSSFEGRIFSRTQQISPVSPRRIQTAKRLDLRPSRDGLDQRQRRDGAVLQ